MAYNFPIVVCGGTFDHFHKGHEAFLSHALSLGGRLIVGLTSGDYVENEKRKTKNAKQIELFEKRKQAVLEFIKREKVLDRAEIVKIDDLFGQTLDKDLKIDAIIVSEETKKGAEIINQKRKESGLKDLKILVAPFVKAQDGRIISSGRIRKGEIDRGGRLYVKKEWFDKDLRLPEELRTRLQKPFGELLMNAQSLTSDKNHLVITVGDVTTKIFNERSLKQNLSVIDFKVERKTRFFDVLELGFSGKENTVNANNPAGFITADLFRKLSEIFKGSLREGTILQISGEEDLAVLPLVLFAPLNTIIYYGQPGQGLVKIEVSEKIKEIVYGLVNKFEMPKRVRHDIGETITRGY